MTKSSRQQQKIQDRQSNDEVIVPKDSGTTSITIESLTQQLESAKFFCMKYGFTIDRLLIDVIERASNDDPMLIKIAKDIKKSMSEEHNKAIKAIQMQMVDIDEAKIIFKDALQKDIVEATDSEQALDKLYDLLSANSPINY